MKRRVVINIYTATDKNNGTCNQTTGNIRVISRTIMAHKGGD